MRKATIIVPTHDHGVTLRYSVASVLWQTLQDFEIFIVGDGVNVETRLVATELARQDKRIRFFDLPKAPRKGELNRAEALRHAHGRIVAYLGDDDLWFPNHLQTLDEVLTVADFGHSMHVSLDSKHVPVPLATDLHNPAIRARMLNELHNQFDLTFGGHTLAAYRRLPTGWETTPPAFPWTDLFMWRKFLAQPWCRAMSAMVPTGICTATHKRPDLSNEQRAEELERLARQVSDPAFHERFLRQIVMRLALDNANFRAKAHSEKAIAALWAK